MQQSQFPQGHSNNSLTDQERQAVRRGRMPRAVAALGGVAAMTMMLFNAGCPGAADMEGPPGGSGPGGGSGGGANNSACEVQCVKDIFAKDVGDCKLCHGAALKSAMLDLETAGVSARLKNVPATFADLSPPGTTPQAAGCPTGALLIDATYPGDSWLYKKLKGTQGTCGTAMPQTPPLLSAADMMCMETYISCVADGKPITTVKPGGAGGTGGAGGSAAGGGGAGGSAAGGGGAGGSAAGGGGAGGASGGGGAGGGGGSGGSI